MAYARETETIQKVEYFGEDWGLAVQKQIVEAGQAKVRANKLATDADGYVEVWVPVQVKLRFDRADDAITLAADGGLRCACVLHMDPDGSSACVCTGPGAADCDCDGGIA